MGTLLKCSACGLSFETEQSMKDHMRTTHSMGGTHPHRHQHAKCNVCGLEFETEADVRQHNKTAHRM